MSTSFCDNCQTHKSHQLTTPGSHQFPLHSSHVGPPPQLQLWVLESLQRQQTKITPYTSVLDASLCLGIEDRISHTPTNQEEQPPSSLDSAEDHDQHEVEHDTLT